MSRGRLLLGAVLVVLGILFLLDQTDVLDGGDTIAEWWPLIFVAAGLLYLSFTPRHVLVPAVLIILGVVLLAGSLDFLPDWVEKAIWPAVLVVIGLWVIFGRAVMPGAARGDRVNSIVAFFGRDIVNDSQQFMGGSILNVFGGTQIDLRNATPAPGGAAIDVLCGFGGVDIWVPEGWRVDIKGLPLFGGWGNKTRREGLPPDAPRLSVEALVAFGGLEVSHGKG